MAGLIVNPGTDEYFKEDWWWEVDVELDEGDADGGRFMLRGVEVLGLSRREESNLLDEWRDEEWLGDDFEFSWDLEKESLFYINTCSLRKNGKPLELFQWIRIFFNIGSIIYPRVECYLILIIVLYNLVPPYFI